MATRPGASLTQADIELTSRPATGVSKKSRDKITNVIPYTDDDVIEETNTRPKSSPAKAMSKSSDSRSNMNSSKNSRSSSSSKNAAWSENERNTSKSAENSPRKSLNEDSMKNFDSVRRNKNAPDRTSLTSNSPRKSASSQRSSVDSPAKSSSSSFGFDSPRRDGDVTSKSSMPIDAEAIIENRPNSGGGRRRSDHETAYKTSSKLRPLSTVPTVPPLDLDDTTLNPINRPTSPRRQTSIDDPKRKSDSNRKASLQRGTSFEQNAQKRNSGYKDAEFVEVPSLIPSRARPKKKWNAVENAKTKKGCVVSLKRM